MQYTNRHARTLISTGKDPFECNNVIDTLIGLYIRMGLTAATIVNRHLHAVRMHIDIR
jgi:hypothetical protein